MRRLSDEQIAQVCHAANIGFQGVIGETFVSEPWSALPDEGRQSVIDGVQSARDASSPREHHDNWLAWKGAHGWTYGPVKDDHRKTHPNFVPWHELPAEQQEKDELFIAIVRELDLASTSEP